MPFLACLELVLICIEICFCLRLEMQMMLTIVAHCVLVTIDGESIRKRISHASTQQNRDLQGLYRKERMETLKER